MTVTIFEDDLKKILECIKRLVHNQPALTEKDREVIKIIDTLTQKDKQ